MRKLFAIVGREWRAYFLSPLAYVILTAYMFLNGIIFSRIVAFLSAPGAPHERFLSLMFTNTYFWIFTLFIVPILTMRLLAEERRSGTLEVLLTSPVSEATVVVGKFLGALGLLRGALGSERPLHPLPAREDLGRPRRGGLGLRRHRAARRILPRDRHVRLVADEEPDPGGDPDVRDPDPGVFGGPLRVGRRPGAAEPDRLPQHLGPHGRVRAGHRRHAPASSTTSRARRSSSCSRRRSFRPRRRRRERPLRRGSRRRRSASCWRPRPRAGRELPRRAPLEAVRLDAGAGLLPLGDHEEDPRRPEDTRPGDGVHDAALAPGPRGQGAAVALPGAQPEDRGRVPRPGAQPGARRGVLQGVGREGQHGRVPFGGPPEVRRGGQARRLRLHRRGDGRGARPSRLSRARRRSPPPFCR